MQHKTTVIYGPPGCGKTHTMLSLLEQELDRGVRPDEVGFVSFTKKATREARERAALKFGLKEKDFPWCRTMHSLALSCTEKSSKQIMQRSDYKKIGNLMGIAVSDVNLWDDQITWGHELGDRLFFMIDLARNKGLYLKSLWEEWHTEDILWAQLEQAQRTLLEYKQNNMKVDFVDLIQEFITRECPPALKVLFVDEAQDLKKLEWQMIEVLAKNVDRVYVAGDDDQAIYKWSGADVEHFINLKGDKTVLGQSYRVPANVAEVANNIVNRIGFRHPKTWLPRSEPGNVHYHAASEQIDMSQGSWLVLARNRGKLAKWNEYCMSQGYHFESLTFDAIRPEAVSAIRSWEALRKGESISSIKVLNIYDMMSVRRGFAFGNKVKLERLDQAAKLTLSELKTQFGLLKDGIWHESLDRITEIERVYLLTALRNGEKFKDQPRIKLSTIHGAKGGEADNVVLITDMAPRTYKEMDLDLDSEHRVWYVGATRAKQNLHVMQADTFYSYNV